MATIREAKDSMLFGRPMNFSLNSVIAPVEYMPAATMKSAPMVSTAELAKPARLRSRGASIETSASLATDPHASLAATTGGSSSLASRLACE